MTITNYTATSEHFHISRYIARPTNYKIQINAEDLYNAAALKVQESEISSVPRSSSGRRNCP